MRRLGLLLVVALLAAGCLGLAALGARWLSGVRERAARRQHGTPDHWPAVARKPAAA